MIKRNEKEIRFIELFAGVGGFRLGLENCGGLLQGEKAEGIQKRIADTEGRQARFTCVWSNEIDKYASDVYEKRFGSHSHTRGDIRKIETRDIPDHDLLVGGFPCQTFSVAGRREGFQDRTRGTLFFEIARVLRDKKPKYLLLENVKGLLNHDGGRTFATIIVTLWELGYNVEWQVLNTKYWIPQNRERVFIFGTRREG